MLISITLKLQKELLERLDEAAQSNYQSRTDYVKQAVVEKLNAKNNTDALEKLLLSTGLFKKGMEYK